MTRARATALFGLALVAAAFYVRPSTEIQSDERAASVYAVVDRGSLALDPYVRQVPDVAYDLAERGGHYYLAKPHRPRSERRRGAQGIVRVARDVRLPSRPA